MSFACQKREAVGDSGEVSRLLEAWGKSDVAARDRMLPLVYQDCGGEPRAFLRRERRDYTLQPRRLSMKRSCG